MMSMRLLIFFVLSILLDSQGHAQKKVKISGVIMLEGMPLQGATIRMINNSNDSLVAFKISDGNGFFQFNPILLYDGAYGLYLSHVETNDSTFNILASDLIEIGWHKKIALKRRDIFMKEIIVKISTLPFKIRGDTVIYEASRYMKEGINKVEDLLKNMEGFVVEGDGRIRYNGKELGKILIEGEDMTGDRYKILSKNIQANLISTVQVVHNFNDNRLMKEVEHSDRIAINLTFKEDKKNKFNGTLDFGFGSPKKVSADIDVVGIHKKIKSLNFINKNNIGIDVSEDILYYWDEKNGSDQNMSKAAGTKSPLQPFHMPLPDLKKTYTSRNNDFAFASIESFKLSKYSTLKFLFTLGKENKLTEGYFLRKLNFQNEPSWEQKSINYLELKNLSGGNKISFRVDNGRNRTALYEVSYSVGKKSNFFIGRNDGFIIDTIKEQFAENNRALNFSVVENFRLKSGLILKVDYFSAKPFVNSAVNIGSERYGGVFLNMNSEKEYQQNLVKYGSINQLDISILGKKKKFSKTWGIHIRQENASYSSDLFYMYNEVPQKLIENKMNFNLLKYYPYASAGYQANKKTFIELHTATGIAKIFNGGLDNISSVIFNSKLSVTYKLSVLNQFRAMAGFSKRPPLMEYFFPPDIIVGNAYIVDGIQLPSFPNSKLFQLGYYRNNLYSGISFSSFLSAEIISRDNSFSIFTTPSFARTSFYMSKRNSQYRSNSTFEKYIYKLKLKTNISLSFNHTTIPSRINGINSVADFYVTESQFKMLSNWKGVFNLEGNISSSIFSLSSLSDRATKKVITRSRLSLKPKIKISEKANTVIYFAKIKNQLQPSFYLCDIMAQWKVGNFVRLTVTGHNLLNNKIFSDKEYGLYEYSEQQYVLATRYVILGFQLDF
jgi:hypothetical protein